MPNTNIKSAANLPQIMAIINITADSFSGDGVLGQSVDQIITAIKQAVQDGADIIDIGGESTRPGSEKITAATELQRIQPVLTGLAQAGMLDGSQANGPVRISIDTYKAEVARVAISAGASIINDISCLQDHAMSKLIASFPKVRYVLTHNIASQVTVLAKGIKALYPQPNRTILSRSHSPVATDSAATRPTPTIEQDRYVDEVITLLRQKVQLLTQQGVKREQIIIDPGFGFGKTVTQNLWLLKEITRLKNEIGLPVLAGVSNKSFLGLVSQVSGMPTANRLAASLAAAVLLGQQGCDIIRTHNSASTLQALAMLEATRNPALFDQK